MRRTIILIRHGKVDIDTKTTINSLAMREWVKEYDLAPLLNKNTPSKKTLEALEGVEYVFSSRLRRSLDSAEVFGLRVDEENSLFNEAEIPPAQIPFFKFRPKVWLIVLRLLLLLKIGQKNSSFQASKKRATKATEYILKYSTEYNKMVLVGHGGLNWLIGKELEKRGWKPRTKPSTKNWSANLYTLD